MGKVLIAYYSRRGENYVNGSIKNLKLGNTEVVAQKIKALLPDADGVLYVLGVIRLYGQTHHSLLHKRRIGYGQ